jgi:hypothetical protein
MRKMKKDPSGYWESLGVKGDQPGHPFRGNQYTDGSGGSESSTATGERNTRDYHEQVAGRIFPSGGTYSASSAGIRFEKTTPNAMVVAGDIQDAAKANGFVETSRDTPRAGTGTGGDAEHVVMENKHKDKLETFVTQTLKPGLPSILGNDGQSKSKVAALYKPSNWSSVYKPNTPGYLGRD